MAPTVTVSTNQFNHSYWSLLINYSYYCIKIKKGKRKMNNFKIMKTDFTIIFSVQVKNKTGKREGKTK